MNTAALLALPDEDYIEVVSENLHESAKTHAAWEVLGDPELLHRTDAALQAMFQRVNRALTHKREENDAVRLECLKRGRGGQVQWLEAKREYDAWRKRAVHFKYLVEQRRALCKTLIKQNNVAVAEVSQAQQNYHNRNSLRLLATAVRRHQGALAADGDRILQEDRELWDLLDAITVPQTLDGVTREVSLRRMLETQWWDVTPSAPDRKRAGVERVMRESPGGKAPVFGTPRVRHAAPSNPLA